ALVVGIGRDVISWPSYRLDELERRNVPLIAGIAPGKHPTRKGWVTRDSHFPKNPFKIDLNARIWRTTSGGKASLREVARGVAMHFRDSTRRYSDPFSYRLLFSVLRGETPALLDLPDRPPAYDDVGRITRWGAVLPELQNFASLMRDSSAPVATPRRRRSDLEEKLAPPWTAEETDHRLTRSAYERVFLKIGSGRQLKIGDEVLTPVKVKGWYHSIFQTPTGEERMLSIDQLLRYMGSWL